MSSKRWKLTGSSLSSRVAQWSQRGLIKSIQNGTINLNGVGSATATVTAVVPENSLLFFLLGDYNASSTSIGCLAYLSLTNATTVTAATTTAFGADTFQGFCLVEYVPGVLKSVQRGVTTINAGLSATATITTVNLTKAIITTMGYSPTTAVLDLNTCMPRTALTNATTVTSDVRAIPGFNVVTSFQVAEYF